MPLLLMMLMWVHVPVLPVDDTSAHAGFGCACAACVGSCDCESYLAMVHAFMFAPATSPVQALAFPALYPTGVNHFGTDRPVKVMPAMYFRIRLDSEDPRFQVGRCPTMI